uniref:Uncharacterized protein n=1 Tax=Ditylenchus dipsaci TaxID=166011 RepID=A0A915D7N1_9BILA
MAIYSLNHPPQYSHKQQQDNNNQPKQMINREKNQQVDLSHTQSPSPIHLSAKTLLWPHPGEPAAAAQFNGVFDWGVATGLEDHLGRSTSSCLPAQFSPPNIYGCRRYEIWMDLTPNTRFAARRLVLFLGHYFWEEGTIASVLLLGY